MLSQLFCASRMPVTEEVRKYKWRLGEMLLDHHPTMQSRVISHFKSHPLQKGKCFGRPIIEILKDFLSSHPPSTLRLTRRGLSHQILNFTGNSRDDLWRQILVR